MALAALSLAALLAASAARADDPDTLRGEADRLQAQGHTLAAEEQEALLELYALESDLARAERRLAVLEDRREELDRRAAAAERELAVARSDAAEAERRLGSRLQTLYVQGEVDPLAVLLGAESLSDALAALDGLGHVATLDGAILREVRQTRGKVRMALDALHERQDEVHALVADAAAERDRLADARRARSAYLAQLAAERVLAERTIARLTARAAAAEASQPSPSPVAPAADPGPAPAPGPSPGPTEPATTMTVSSTGYCLRGTTSTGIPTGWGVVAVDPAVIPLGTRMSIPGYGEGVAADTGAAVRGATIDVWFPRCSQALAWGRRVVTITFL